MACGGCNDTSARNYDESADWNDGSCEYQRPWDYVITGSNHTHSGR